jgi:hypothetical protein
MRHIGRSASREALCGALALLVSGSLGVNLCSAGTTAGGVLGSAREMS